jgi:ArsR family transcriptional regulator
LSVLLKPNETKTDLSVQQAGTCEVTFVNREKIAEVKKKLKPDSTVNQLAETFKALGDTTRLKIIYVLSQAELCVCDIAALLGLSDSAVSHQLRVLRNMRLVKYRKEGKMAYYTLDDDHIESLFKEGLKHVEEK